MLCDDGGHPAYDISLLEDVSKDPDKYLEVLWPWVSDRKDCDVFCCQMKRWEDFRLYQRYWRREGWFASYVKGLNDGLANYDETRIYQLNDHYLDKDPARQGELETWIEYVLFECLERDKFLLRVCECYQDWNVSLGRCTMSTFFSKEELLKNRARGLKKGLFPVEDYDKIKKNEEEELEKARSRMNVLSQTLLAQQSGYHDPELEMNLATAEFEVNSREISVARCNQAVSLIIEHNEQENSYIRAQKEKRPYHVRIEWICDHIRWLEYKLGVELPRRTQTVLKSQENITEHDIFGNINSAIKKPDHDHARKSPFQQNSLLRAFPRKKSISLVVNGGQSVFGNTKSVFGNTESVFGNTKSVFGNTSNVFIIINNNTIQGPDQDHAEKSIFHHKNILTTFPTEENISLVNDDQSLSGMADNISNSEDDLTKELHHHDTEEKPVQEQITANADDVTTELHRDDVNEKPIHEYNAENVSQTRSVSYEHFEHSQFRYQMLDMNSGHKDDAKTKLMKAQSQEELVPEQSAAKTPAQGRQKRISRVSRRKFRRFRNEGSSDHKPFGSTVVRETKTRNTPTADHTHPYLIFPPRRSARIAEKLKPTGRF